MTGRSVSDDDGEPLPVDDFTSHVLDVVDSIPAGRVMSYGDIAEYLGWVRGEEKQVRAEEGRLRAEKGPAWGDKQGTGPGPRQVGRVMSVYGGAVPWWRVIHADGTPAPGHERAALARYLAEGTPLRSARPPVRVDMRRARWRGRP